MLPALGKQRQEEPWSLFTRQSSQPVNSGFSERLCLRNVSWRTIRHLMSTSSLHMCTCVHTQSHANTHIHICIHTYKNNTDFIVTLSHSKCLILTAWTGVCRLNKKKADTASFLEEYKKEIYRRPTKFWTLNWVIYVLLYAAISTGVNSVSYGLMFLHFHLKKNTNNKLPQLSLL